MTIGTKYKNKKGKTFTVKKVADAQTDLLISQYCRMNWKILNNRRVFGREAFLGEFKFIKEVQNG